MSFILIFKVGFSFMILHFSNEAFDLLLSASHCCFQINTRCGQQSIANVAGYFRTSSYLPNRRYLAFIYIIKHAIIVPSKTGQPFFFRAGLCRTLFLHRWYISVSVRNRTFLIFCNTCYCWTFILFIVIPSHPCQEPGNRCIFNYQLRLALISILIDTSPSVSTRTGRCNSSGFESLLFSFQ